MIGRLVHHAEILSLKHDSYRPTDRDLGPRQPHTRHRLTPQRRARRRQRAPPGAPRLRATQPAQPQGRVSFQIGERGASSPDLDMESHSRVHCNAGRRVGAAINLPGADRCPRWLPAFAVGRASLSGGSCFARKAGTSQRDRATVGLAARPNPGFEYKTVRAYSRRRLAFISREYQA